MLKVFSRQEQDILRVSSSNEQQDILLLKVNRHSTPVSQSQVRFYHYRQVCEIYLAVRGSESKLSANAVAWTLM